MNKNKFALKSIVTILLLFGFVACDKDFISLDSDVINQDNATNFDILSEQYDIISYTKPFGPVQTNGLEVNSLGIYDDIYGRTTSSFLSQLTLPAPNPTFGDGVEIDSVVLNIPYFARTSGSDDDGNIIYLLDSVYNNNDIKLQLFESNYFLRDFDPNGDFGASQPFFSNQSASTSEDISDTVLEGQELTMLTGPETSHIGGNIVKISNEGFNLTEADNEDEDDLPQITQRISPGLRIKLDTEFWKTKILDMQGNAVLGSQSSFNEYFRGLYFKADLPEMANEGSYFIFNATSSNTNVTIYYSRLTASTADDEDERETSSFSLRLGPIGVNFLDNEFTLPIEEGDPNTGDTRLFLKGGEGSVAGIKLFNGDDVDDNPEVNSFEAFKNFFVDTDEEGELVIKRLVNEANLVFYVDQDIVDGNEPNRIYVYDADNNRPLEDYFLDATNNNIPSLSKFSHLGPLQRVDDEATGAGIKYKLKITSHINGLLLREQSNVELGLAVSLNVNSENPTTGGEQRVVQTGDGSDLSIPISSVMSQRGTVLHGNNTEDESKRVYLEVYYTEPN